jgi:hypothetical protein
MTMAASTDGPEARHWRLRAARRDSWSRSGHRRALPSRFVAS